MAFQFPPKCHLREVNTLKKVSMIGRVKFWFNFGGEICRFTGCNSDTVNHIMLFWALLLRLCPNLSADFQKDLPA